MTHIPFVNLKSQYHFLKDELNHAIAEVLENTDFILGKEVQKFEQRFAQYCGVNYCVGVNSGTSALFLALLAMGIKKGDEVIVPTNTFIATAEAISHTGANPVLIDISDDDTYLLDVSKIESAVTLRTKVIIPVHLYGQIVPMMKIKEIAQKHNLWILEDACQAHGSSQNNKKAGSWGDATAFSFYPGKNLGAYGEGGAIVTNNESIAEKIKILRDHGSPKKYIHDVVGYNMRMEGIQACVLNVKLPYLDSWNEKRNQIACEYIQKLSNIFQLKLPKILTDNHSNFHLFVIRTSERDDLQEFLNKNGIATGIHYPVPIHLQKAYSFLGQKKGSLPVAEGANQEILSLPIYPDLTSEQVNYVIDKIKEFFNQ